jgi:hypothetical protein
MAILSGAEAESHRDRTFGVLGLRSSALLFCGPFWADWMSFEVPDQVIAGRTPGFLAFGHTSPRTYAA